MIYDAIIVGAGPGGISASIYAASRGLNVLVLEKKEAGGTIRKVSNVTHYSGVKEDETGKTFSDRLYNQAVNTGVEFKFEEVNKVNLEGDTKEIITSKNTYQAKVIILANGTTPRDLGIPGEKEFMGNGVSYYLSDDKEIYRDKEVFVVGGSDGAVKEALFLSSLAKKVNIIYRGDNLGAIDEFKSKVEKTSNIELILNSALKSIKGDKNIELIEIEDVNSGDSKTIEASNTYILIYAGSTPNSQMYPSIDKEDEYIIVDEKMETNIKGVYAAGDICKKQIRQIATAVSDGAIAGINSAAYILNRS